MNPLLINNMNSFLIHIIRWINKSCKANIFLILLIIISQKCYSQEPPFNIAIAGGSESFDEALATTSDNNYNIYTAGYFSGTVDFNTSHETYNLTASGPSDIFIQKTDSSGNLIWALRFGGTGVDKCNALAYDKNGNLYLAGFFNATANFTGTSGNINLVSAGSQDIFIAKLDTAGNLLFAKSIGSTGNESANGISIDVTGNLLVTGSFQGIVNFNTSSGNNSLISNGYSDIFIAKYSADGNLLWANCEGSSLNDAGNSICVSKSGNIYVTGFFSGTPDFNTGTDIFNMQSVGGIDIFIQKFDSAGKFIWAKQAGGPGADEGLGIAIDNSENVYTTGRFDSTADFDGGASIFKLISKGNSDAFIQKQNNAGDFVFAKNIGNKQSDLAKSITVSNNKDIFFTGYYQDTVDFNPGPKVYNLKTYGLKDAFIERMDTAGNFLWAVKIGGAGNDMGNAISTSINSKINVAGHFSKVTDFNYTSSASLNFTSKGSVDFFAMQLDNCSGQVADITSIGASALKICFPDTVKLFVSSGQLNSAINWRWYTGSCGETLIGTGDTIYVSPDTSTTYYARGEGGCVQPAVNCANVTLEVSKLDYWYQDIDNDGYYNDSLLSCFAPDVNGWTKIKPVNGFGDCNDSNALSYIPLIWYKDQDGDGYYNDSTLICDIPIGNGWTLVRPINGVGDCNDSDAMINPSTIWYHDGDGDGYFGTRLIQCLIPTGIGWSLLPGNGSGDCDDSNSAINPGVAEICGNGIDDNCNNFFDEGCFSVSATTTAITCNGGKATITASALNGTPPYNFSINGNAFKSGNTFVVIAGTYIITAKDSLNNTVNSTPVIVTQPTPISISFTKKDLSCFGGNDGSITIHASGGTPPYQYSFDDGLNYQPDSVKGNLSAGGSYILRVKDANNCMQRRIGLITLFQPPKLSILGACYLITGRVLGVQGTGGTKPYTFSINGTTYTKGNQRNGDANTWTAIKAGVYTIYIKDANNCLTSKVIKTDTLIPCPSSAPALSLRSSNINSVTESDLEINDIGTNDFSIVVSPNPSSNHFSILVKQAIEMFYSVKITDISGRIVYSQNKAFGNCVFGENFSTGVYMAEISDGNTIKHFKIIKQ